MLGKREVVKGRFAEVCKKVLAMVFLTALQVGLAGCFGHEVEYREMSVPPTEFLIGPEDVLVVTVWRNQELSKEVIVRPDGKISLPLIGDITAAGLTAQVLSKQIADGLAAAPARGTMAACIPMEKSSFPGWLADKILELQKANPGNDAAVMAGTRELLAGFEGTDEGQPNQTRANFWEQVTKAAGGTSEGIVKLLRDEVQLYDRLAAIMALPQPEYDGQAKQFSAEIEKSTNHFVTLTFPAFEKARQKEFAILVELAMVRAAVEYKLNGEPGLQSVTDPCGQGPFAFERFVFDGVDRGFQLKSAYAGRGFPEVLIFVEKDGPPFRVNWKNAGQALSK